MKNRLSFEHLAGVLGINRSYMSLIASGKKTPSNKLCRRLEEVTGIFAAVWAFGSPEQKKLAMRNFLREAKQQEVMRMRER